MRTKTSRFLLCLSALSLLMAALVFVPNMRAAQAQSVSIEQTQMGNIFTVGTTPKFTVKTSATEASWSAYDYWGTKVLSGTAEVADGSAELEVPVPESGYHRLRVSIGAAEQLQSVDTTFAVVPEATAPADDGFVFGMQTHFAQGWSTDLVSLLKLAGVESVRDQLSWAEIEATKGEYNFAGKYDKYVRALHDNGVALMPNFGVANENYDDGATPHSEAGQAGYARFVQEVVKHYDTEVEAIGVYNEPNLRHFGDHGDGPADATPQNYFSLLQKTYNAVKEADPDVAVTGPELGAAQTHIGLWRPWLDKFFELGGLDYADNVSLHPYRDRCCTPEGLDDDIEMVRELMAEHGGGDKPIFITEQGWTTKLNSEEEQAAYLLRTYTQAMKAGVGRFNWYNFMDGKKAYGLLREPDAELGSHTPKPVFVTYAVLVNQLSGRTYQTSDDSLAGVRSHTFGNGDDTKSVLWAPENEKTVALKTAGPVDVTDMMGVTRTLQPVDGQVTITLTDDPVYVTGTVDSMLEDTQFGIQGEDSAASDDVPGTLTLNNPTSGERTATFTVSGNDHELTAPGGQSAELRVDIPSGGLEGRRALRAEVSVDGKLTGLLTNQVEIDEDAAVRLVPKVADGGDGSLNVEVTNNRRGTDYTFEEFDWRVDDQSGTESVGRTIAPGATESIPIALSQKENWVQYPSGVTVRLAGLPALRQTDEIGFNPAAAQTLTIDGDLGELADTAHLELGEHGELVRADPDGPPYEGPKDLSGPIWMTADETNLYVAAEVTDDAHFNDQTGQGMRENDSIHFALSKGMPGETKDFYEYIVALTEPDGPKVIRNLAPTGEPTGPAKDVQLEVKRDEANTKTIYEFAIPWDDMKQIDFADGVVSVSTLANDNDGDDMTDAEGWIQWGGGINGGKDPALYRAVDLQGAR